MFSYIFVTLLQVEQEIDFVLGKKDVVKAGTAAWVTKWVPAILQHSDTLTGKLGTIYKQNQMACHGMCPCVPYRNDNIFYRCR